MCYFVTKYALARVTTGRISLYWMVYYDWMVLEGFSIIVFAEFIKSDTHIIYYVDNHLFMVEWIYNGVLFFQIIVNVSCYIQNLTSLNSILFWIFIYIYCKMQL